jgi:acyl-lipid omega-6 desaturase (Delta-12 desaturase)
MASLNYLHFLFDNLHHNFKNRSSTHPRDTREACMDTLVAAIPGCPSCSGEDMDVTQSICASADTVTAPELSWPLPTPTLTHLKPANTLGFFFVGLALALTAIGLVMSTGTNIAMWMAGQLLLAVGFLQWFVLLHEAGHNNLFRTKRLNRLAGWIAGFMALIPFGCWKLVHGMHHRWTGWQDLDMTTATLTPRKLSRLERVVINTCWRLWIPLFSTLYRINNFWNLPRLQKVFPYRAQRRRVAFSIAVSLALYGCVIYYVGPLVLLRLVGLGLLLTFMMQDVLILSQHTHVPMQLSGGETVPPFAPKEQEVFTRSLRFPAWFSTFILLHVDAHELHHMYPRVPGYYLNRIPYRTHNEVGFWDWMRKARRLPAEVFLFQNRHTSGADV